MTPYERVKLSRERTAATFPLPSVLDCIRYSLCELCEYDDALLRQERTGDKRNNDKAHDPRSELGQALYMLLSAYTQVEFPPELYPMDQRNKKDSSRWYAGAMTSTATALGYVTIINRNSWDIQHPMAQEDLGRNLDLAYANMFGLALSHGWPVDALIDDTCIRFEAKHAPREAR